MKYSEVLIGDEDRGYVDAFVHYLMEHRTGRKTMMSITGISDIDEFERLSGKYKLGFLGKRFYEKYRQRADSIRVDRCMMLTEDPSEDEENGFFKYQSMESVERLIFENEITKGSAEDIKIYSVYSPAKYDLSLECALCIAKHISKYGRTAFLDLSEIGILHRIMEANINEDLLDVIFMMDNQEGFDVSNYIINNSWFGVLVPALVPAQLPYITPHQWEQLIKRVGDSGYENLVIFFGGIIQGFFEICAFSQKLYIIQKSGTSYYESEFSKYCEILGNIKNMVSLKPPLAAANINRDGYGLDAILEGKMMDYVKETLDAEDEYKGYTK